MPRQHGAWAMLVVPCAIGAALAWQDGQLPSYIAPMFATWVAGYFAFNAASGFLKSPRSRRGSWLGALGLYSAGALAAGLLTLWEAGPAPAWWLVGFAPPLVVALVLAARRDERNLAGGLLTVLLASAMLLVVSFPDPTVMLADPAFPHAAVLSALVFGYFGGTVFHVKAMIRRRHELAWRNLSIGWHALWTLLTAAGVITGHVGRWWPLFFLVATIRAWLLPVIAERRPVRPLVVGLVEIALSAALLVIAVAEQPIG